MPLEIGTRLGPYEIVAPLGEGGMGDVYRAQDVRLGRTVAVKVLPLALAADEDTRSRFRREARAASAINHVNVAHIYDVGEEDGHHFIAMEYVDGEPLSRVIEKGPLSSERVVDIGLRIAEALEAAHAQGVIHRDIKAANVVTAGNGQVKVLDFGLARRTSGDGSVDTRSLSKTLTQVGVIVGTVPYMSPEQALGQPVDGRTDIFSLGVVLYEMATGARPFDGSSHVETMHRICHVEPESVSGRGVDVPQGLASVIDKCLAKDPEARYTTAAELAADLRSLAAGAAPTATVTAPRASNGRSIDSIAVLPFENGSNDEEVDYLCDGLTESLINTLARLPGLKVISRNSVFTFKGKQSEPREVSRALGVRAILMGRMVQRGSNLAISAELIDAPEDRQLWGGRFNRPADDLLAVETEMANTITEKLSLELSGAAAKQVATRPTTQPAAYRAYLRGKHFLEGTAADMDRALEMFREAAEADPDFALAHAAIGDAYLLRSLHGTIHPDEALREASRAVARAKEIDPDLPQVRMVAGNIALLYEWDWEKADTEFRMALALAPNDSHTHMEYALLLWCYGDFDRALVHAKKAVDLDPLSRLPMHHVGYSYLGNRQFKEAIEAFDRTLEVHTDWVWGNTKKAMALAYDGQHEAALKSAARAEELIARGGETPLLRAWLGVIYAKCGETAKAREALASMQATAEKQYVDPVELAEIFTALGEYDQALAMLERGYAERSPTMVWVTVLFIFDPLRDEPRFQAIIKNLAVPVSRVSAA